MNTFLSVEQEALLARYRAFVEQNIAANAEILDVGNQGKELRDLISSLGQEGLLATSVSKEYGGQGAPFINFILLCQAIAECEPGIVLALAAHCQVMELLMKFGTDKQRSRYLPLLARGEVIGTFATSEETAGSDYAAVKASVTKQGDKFVLSGRKTWTVNGEIATLALVLARHLKDGEDNGRLSIWLVDLEENPSIKVNADRPKLGLRSTPTNDLEFSDVQLDSDAYLGAVSPVDASSDEACDQQVQFALQIGKVIMAAASVGLAHHAIDESVKRARAREQFGSNIGKFQAIQWKLADMSAETAAAGLLTYRAAWAKDSSVEEFPKFAAMCKYYAAKAARVHSSEAVQIFGAHGLCQDEPIEKMYRDAKVLEIVEGTSEIQKNIIATAVRS